MRTYVLVGGSRNGETVQVDDRLRDAVMMLNADAPGLDAQTEVGLYNFRQVHLFGRVFEVLVATTASSAHLSPETLLQALLKPDAYVSWKQGRRAEVAPW